jgi:phage replication initiation protein
MTLDKSFYLLDYLSFTSKIHSPENIIEMLGLQNITWQTIKGARGYRDKLYYDCCNIHYNGRDDMGVWCELSGQGCRVFESFGHGDWHKLLDNINYHGSQMNITRIDIAFDDHDGLLSMDKLFWDTYKKNFVSKHDFFKIEYSSKGITIYHGVSNSEVMIRIYDKAAERGLTDGSHWVRVELQLRDGAAKNFAKKFVSGGEDSVGDIFLGTLKNYLRYVKPNKDDSNRDRWAMTKYWARFIGAAKRVRLFQRPGTEYNLRDLEHFVIKQAGNAISTYIDIKGVDSFMDELQKRGTHQNPKYEQLKSQYRNN